MLWVDVLLRVCVWACLCGCYCQFDSRSVSQLSCWATAQETNGTRPLSSKPGAPASMRYDRAENIYFNSEFKQRERISLKQLAIQLLWTTKYSSYIIKSRCGFKSISQFLFLSSCLHEFPPTAPNTWRSGELKMFSLYYILSLSTMNPVCAERGSTPLWPCSLDGWMVGLLLLVDY